MSMIIPGFGYHRTNNYNNNNVYDPFSVELWNPFEEHFFHIPTIPNETLGFVNATTDWKETPEAHIFRADLPGLRKDEVKVEVEEDRVLKISGERSVEREEKKDRWHRVERSSGKFVRAFRLPESARVDQLKASMQDGVLTVTVPKAEARRAGVKSIHIS
ncbi:18.1 kDa class I heat shock protein-like [Rhododendron vialii]|uniref:18.1 kDa class I heat shock protein-like n=1 Tax=Rhododendron vialii TaxID=182163 RepID=UPI00265E2D6E|nr:18.1 kDa class I heat shock protein-like [Rhododendron vialii]